MTTSVAARRLAVRRLRSAWPGRRGAFKTRAILLLNALDVEPSSTRLPGLIDAIDDRLADCHPEELWLALSVLTSDLPYEDVVVDVMRRSRLDGPIAGLTDHLLPRSAVRRLIPPRTRRVVSVARDSILVDVDHTASVNFATGIQRVVRETSRRWAAHADVVLVGWSDDRAALRILEPDERDRALQGGEKIVELGKVARLRRRLRVQKVIVPVGGVYLMPELVLERGSLFRLAGLARMSTTRTGALGHDMVPISTAETVDFLVSGGFSQYLAALKHFDRVAAISEAAAFEFRSWVKMLAGSGVAGPQVDAVSLPLTEIEGDVDHLEQPDDRPLVLCVGSHEPRKNHLAVLAAAERCWARGAQFDLTFVGGNSWAGAEFAQTARALTTAGRSIQVLKEIDDATLSSLYRHARCTLFPSLNEGFGLPVAESLAFGTPVIASRFGSLADMAVDGGVLGVDPRDDGDIADGLWSMLNDDDLHDRLAREARERPRSTWDSYARRVWYSLVERKDDA